MGCVTKRSSDLDFVMYSIFFGTLFYPNQKVRSRRRETMTPFRKKGPNIHGNDTSTLHSYCSALFHLFSDDSRLTFSCIFIMVGVKPASSSSSCAPGGG